MEEKYDRFGEPVHPKDPLEQPDTVFQKTLNILSLLLFAFTLVYPAIKWRSLPDRIICHWGISGQADGWSGKSSVLFLPVITLFLYVLLTVVTHFPSVWNMPGKITEKNRTWAYRNIKNMMVVLKFLMLLNFSYLTWCSIQQKNLGTLYLLLSMVLLFGSMAFFILRSTRCPIDKAEEDLSEDRDPF